ncbi:hypothetical protein LWI29_015295 [Acer saccharum]|uniref:Uncharacterized protein n=1 Tax=Acer saccharum TaxID=4024 RepID=A0AA39T5B7_ACESA|nr:hypothetical protein LWI29_015295 [Acer saccharum]
MVEEMMPAGTTDKPLKNGQCCLTSGPPNKLHGREGKTLAAVVRGTRSIRGNCGALTLALIEHTVAKRKKLNWTDEQMPHMRLKMAVEVFSNSIVSV